MVEKVKCLIPLYGLYHISRYGLPDDTSYNVDTTILMWQVLCVAATLCAPAIIVFVSI